jgi:hypothetical protein
MIIGENYWLSKTDIATKTLPYDGNRASLEPGWKGHFFYFKKLWNAVSPVDKYIKIIVLLTIPFENEKI